MRTSAEMLEGVLLPDGWRVVSAIPRPPDGTGGNFSKGYIVESQEGTRAFLKALDYSRALRAPDPARALQALTEAFNFERDLLHSCRDHHMDKIVTAIADGTINIPGAQDGGVVQYLIFELADGDVRSQVNIAKRLDTAWSLRSLHHVAIGLNQLHTHGIAHQDLKPSNVLVFAGTVSKVADLGRAAYKGHNPPHENLPVAGDPTYAPPELLYGYIDSDWSRRRSGCDAYLMGSMVVFFFTGMGMTPLLRMNLRTEHAWGRWPGSYEEVLPYVRDAFTKTVQSLHDDFDDWLREDLLLITKELCEPDPRLRGHPRNRARKGNQYSLERYISRLNLLARRAELKVFSR